VFYPAFGYFISHLPTPSWPDAPGQPREGRVAVGAWGAPMTGPSAVSLDTHRRTAVLLQQAVEQRLAEQFL
jgi:hypothetical protein